MVCAIGLQSSSRWTSGVFQLKLATFALDSERVGGTENPTSGGHPETSRRRHGPFGGERRDVDGTRRPFAKATRGRGAFVRSLPGPPPRKSCRVESPPPTDSNNGPSRWRFGTKVRAVAPHPQRCLATSGMFLLQIGTRVGSHRTHTPAASMDRRIKSFFS